MASGGLEPEHAERLLAGYVLEIGELLPTTPPPLAGAAVYRDLRGRLASPDIFASIKKTFTSGLLGALPTLRATICTGPSACANALRASTWGNLLDVAQGRAVPSQADILGMVSTPLLLDDTGEFLERLSAAATLLVVGDNAGETVLDRLFLELLPSTVRASYAVRPCPVLNDATYEDAEMAGISGFAEVIRTGLDAPTVRRGLMSDDFEELFSSADLILAKGQGNLEGLLGICDPRLFYSFVVKCPVISDLTGLPEGSGVFASSLRLPGWRF
jgi:uncharacterized protein with ATP-grasp and redox domains